MADYTELLEELRLESENMHYAKEDCVLFAQAAEAIEELQQIAGHYEEAARDYFRDVCYYLDRVPKWIPVTERLPERNEDCLAVIKTEIDGAVWQSVKSTYYIRDQGFMDEGHHERVSHWMPLPKPPEEEK